MHDPGASGPQEHSLRAHCRGGALAGGRGWQMCRRDSLTGKMLEIKTSVYGLEVKASDLTGKYTDLKATVDGLSSEVKKDTKITGGGNLRCV